MVRAVPAGHGRMQDGISEMKHASRNLASAGRTGEALAAYEQLRYPQDHIRFRYGEAFLNGSRCRYPGRNAASCPTFRCFTLEGSPRERSRDPEASPLYRVVAGHLETFLARQRQRERHVPAFVEDEFRSFLDCGRLCRGFLRVHCQDCGLDRLVPFSCKGRTFCPSCGGRRIVHPPVILPRGDP